MDSSLHAYQEKVRAKREKDKQKKSMERGRVDRDIVETWLGDEADDPAKSGGGDDNEDSWPIPENVPYEVDWADFLAHHHWSDEVVLDRQEAIHVHRMWVIYEYQLATGLLQPPSLF